MSDGTYQLVAGHLALDFVNTVADRGDPANRRDLLVGLEDVRRWVRQAALPDWAGIGAGRSPGGAALERLRTVREQLFALFQAVATGAPIPARTLDRIGNALQDCQARRRLSVEGGAVRWAWRSRARGTDYLLYPVLTSAADLLTSDARRGVRQCEGDGCGWLFLDRSNARKRRWCSMADCGNRNKAREYYRRATGLA